MTSRMKACCVVSLLLTALISVVPQSVRVLEGILPYHGRMEYFHNGGWTSICADTKPTVSDWPSLFCRQLGQYSHASTVTYAKGNPTINVGTGALTFTNPTCPANAKSLSDCSSGTACNHTLDLVVKCIDIDECSTNAHNCTQRCQNTEGSFVCECNDGYYLDRSDKVTCHETNECLVGLSECDRIGICINTNGSYVCRCPEIGYTLNADGKRCDDVDECDIGNHNCSDICNNNRGSYTCSCHSGYRLKNDSRSCEDVDECIENTHGCSHICTNSNGSFTCSCPAGYNMTADNKTCGNNDIDECNAGIHGCSHKCNNTEGSYICSCNAGYSLAANARDCSDTDECKTGFHGCSHDCNNTQGSYICNCHAGYRLAADDRDCFDIDECSFQICDQGCTNTPGSYTCTCNAFHTLQADKKSCKVNALLVTAIAAPAPCLACIASISVYVYKKFFKK